MKKLRNKRDALAVILLGLLLIEGCQSDQKGFEKTPDGLYFKFHEQNTGGSGVLPGDLVTVDVVFRTEDTIFFVSSRDLNVPYQFEILPPRFPGDLYDALMLMSEGDSATFIIPGDSLFLFDFEIQELPGFIGAGTRVFMDVRMVRVLPREEFRKEKEAYRERSEKMYSELKEREEAVIREYITRNGITVKPTESGMYFIEVKRGTGPPVTAGKHVTVDYSAMFISGEIFETTKQDIAVKYNIFDSVMIYQPFEYLHGDSLTIAGWEEGLSYMRQGGKARLIIPSALAYGEAGVEGYIPPYTPLLYEVEVLEVK